MRLLVLITSALASLAASRIAAATPQYVGQYGAWTLLRDEPDASTALPTCSLATQRPDRSARVDLSPARGGLLFVIVAQADGPTQLAGPYEQLGISWVNAGEGADTVDSYPIAGFRFVPGPPARAFMHVVLRRPEQVRNLIAAGSASRRLILGVPPGTAAFLDSTGFAEAWAALKACDPSSTAGLP